MLRKIIKWLPLTVVLVVVVVVNFLPGVLPLEKTPGESLIMGLLAILAIDALGERIGLLENIDDRLGKLETGLTSSGGMQETLQNLEHRLDELEFRHDPVLSTQEKILKQTPIKQIAAPNADLSIVGASAKSLIEGNGHIFEEAKSARVVLMNPNCASAVETYFLMSDYNMNGEVNNTVRELRRRIPNLEIRFVDFYLPYTMLGADIHKNNGRIMVNYRGYDTGLPDRHSLFLTQSDNQTWFNEYVTQFEKLWTDCDPVSGSKKTNSPIP